MIYLVQKKSAKWILTLWDLFCSILPKRKSNRSIRHILLCNPAHLGDIVISTCVLAPLKKQFPDAKIGFLISTACKPVLENHPLIDRLHFLDHWKLSRAPLSLPKKILHYFRQRRAVLKEIAHYDLAIDLYLFFPNSIFTLWSACIPQRIGFTSGGSGPLLTASLDYQEGDHSLPYHYSKLLERLGIFSQPLLPQLFSFASKKKYIIIHPGTGAREKEWEESHWDTVVQKLSEQNIPVFITGHGEKEKKRAERLSSGRANCSNLVGKLLWPEFISTIQSAYLLISVDTVALHIASAFNVPTLAIFQSTPTLFRPSNPHCKVLLKTVTPYDVIDEYSKITSTLV